MMTASSPPLALRPATSVVVQTGGNDGEAVVDVRDLAGDAARQVRQQEGRDVADFLGGDVATHRRVGFDECLDLREAVDARGGERLDRPCGNAVDANAFRTETRGQV